MPVETQAVEYQTVVVGAAYLVKELLSRLGVVAAIDAALTTQPSIGATYGQLAQVIIVNRMTFQPQPLYHMADWATQHGIDRLFGLQAQWLDDDRQGAMLEALAEHQVTIWTSILANAVAHFAPDLEWLHADTTSVYFEGAYADETGVPKGGGERVPCLVEGYNKDGQRQKVQMVLSLITSGRLPVWYRPWDGNQTDDGVYLADMTSLRQTLLAPDNAVLIGDRKLCNHATMVAFCQQQQQFLAPHPWTDTAQAVWRTTYHALAAQEQTWTAVDYVSRNDAAKPPDKRPQYRVCEVAHDRLDKPTGQLYRLRWVFSHSSRKAEQDARRRSKVLEAGEAALQRIARLLGKYDYTTRATIERRIEAALRKAGTQAYWAYTLDGSQHDQGWTLRWEKQQDVLTDAECFDGVALLCTNVPAARLAADGVMVKYKAQVGVEQTIDFIKSPVQIRPMWLHSPKRLAGLTLLIMIAVLVAALLEYQVRRWIAHTGHLVEGLMPEKRDTPYPTAKAILRAFADYALVIVRHPDGQEELHCPKLRPVQQQIFSIMDLSPPSAQPCPNGSGK